MRHVEFLTSKSEPSLIFTWDHSAVSKSNSDIDIVMGLAKSYKFWKILQTLLLVLWEPILQTSLNFKHLHIN